MSFAAGEDYSHGFVNEHLSSSLAVPSMDDGGGITGGRRPPAVPPVPVNSRSYSQYDSNVISNDSLPQARRSSSLPLGPSHSFDGNAAGSFHQQQPQQQHYLSSSPGQSQQRNRSPAVSTFSPNRSKPSSISSASGVGGGFPTASYENLSYSYDSPVNHRSYSNNSNTTPYEGRFSAINSPSSHLPVGSSLPLALPTDVGGMHSSNRDSFNSRHSRNPSNDSLTDTLMMGNSNNNPNNSNLGSSVPPVPSLLVLSSPLSSSSYFQQQQQQMNTPPPPGLIPNSSAISSSSLAINLSAPFASSSNISTDV
jgi:hypothetical protein